MKLLRNPEIKRNIIIYTVISAIALLLGFFSNIPKEIIIILIIIVFLMVHLVSDYIRYRNIEKLSEQINKALHGEYRINFNDLYEGELSILCNEIHKLFVKLQEQKYLLLKDKLQLTEAIADISHQLKTPLTSINLMLMLLEKPDLSNERRYQLVKELNILLARIDWLINTLLKISKIDSKTANFKKEKIVVKDLIEQTIETFSILIELKEIEIKMDISNNSVFIGDMLWSVEAIGNILKNCIEHTDINGNIKIIVSHNPIYTEILIIDDGKGIAKEDLPYLFDRFYKGKNSSINSVGIGLALARKIIKEQNGIIKVENNVDKGTKFTIRFYIGNETHK